MTQKTIKKKVVKITKRHQPVIELFKKSKKPLTRREVQEKLNLSFANARILIKELREVEIIEVVGFVGKDYTMTKIYKLK